MDLQLKRVEFSERLSQETNAFAADVWFRGKKVGYAQNDGHGGCTYVHSYGPETHEAFHEAEKYAESLPDIVYEGRGKFDDLTIKSNLEQQVDRLFQDWLEAKELKINSNKGVFYEQPNGGRRILAWKGHTIAKMKKHPMGVMTIKEAVKKLKKEGNKILNTNLEGII
jgi:hypothetical protein